MKIIDGWQHKKLTELAEYINGYAFKPDDWGKEGLPIVRIEQLKNHLSITDFYFGRLPEKNVIDNGDLIFSWSASLFLRIWQHGKAVLNQHLFKVVEKPGINRTLLKQFIEFHLPEITKASHGSTMQHITRKELDRFGALFPVSKHEQAKISEILSTVDRAIEQTEALIAKQQRIKTGLMHDLLTRGIDERGNLRSEETHQFKDSPLGRIPMQWEICSISDVAKKEPGSTAIGPFGSDLVASDYRIEGIPIIFVRDIRVEGFLWKSNVFVSEEKAAQLKAHIVRSGDVVITKMGLPPCLAVVYPATMQPGVITADIIKLTPDFQTAISNWIAAILNTPQVRTQVRRITGGVTRPKITLTDFRRLIIPIPSLDEQKEIIRVLHSLNANVDQNTTLLEKLQQMKTALMQDLLTGKKRVISLLNETEVMSG